MKNLELTIDLLEISYIRKWAEEAEKKLAEEKVKEKNKSFGNKYVQRRYRYRAKK